MPSEPYPGPGIPTPDATKYRDAGTSGDHAGSAGDATTGGLAPAAEAA